MNSPVRARQLRYCPVCQNSVAQTRCSKADQWDCTVCEARLQDYKVIKAPRDPEPRVSVQAT